MPGSYLNLDLPTGSDPMVTIVAKLVAALSAIQDDLTPDVTPSQININAALNMNGAALINTGSVQFVTGNVPTLPGSVYYNNGEIYVIDATGPVRLTLNGALDAASIGGIGGLGGTTAAETYDLASTQFRFTSATGVWADLVARHLILEGVSGSVQFGVDSAIATSRQINIKSLPGTGTSLMVYNGATSTVEDGAVTGATNTLAGSLAVAAALTAGTTVTATDYKLSGTVGQDIDLFPSPQAASTSACNVTDYANGFATSQGILATAGSWSWNSKSLLNWMRDGDRLKQITLLWRVKSTGTATISLVSVDCGTDVQTTIQSFTDVGTGAHSLTCTLTTPPTVTTGAKLYIYITASDASAGDRITRINLAYDHP